MKSKLSKIIPTLLLGTMLLYTIPAQAFTKDETVFSNANADGTIYNTIVTEHLINENDEKLLKDITSLLNIENTSGDETYKEEGKYIVWDANGNDIYYKGKTTKEAPINISVKYLLDGKEIAANEMAGKSGKLKIKIEFNNNEEHQVKVNGKKAVLYTPFAVAFGTYINNEKGKNIETVNGKIIDDGSKTMVAGLAFPGMKDSLDLDNQDIIIPESTTITLDAKNFEMNNIICYVTPIVLEDEEIEIFNKIDEVYSKINTLRDATNQLVDGSKQLSEGTVALDEGANKLYLGAEQLSNGTNQIEQGSKQISTNMISVANGTKEIKNGQSQLTNGLAQIRSGLPNEDENNENEQKLNYLKTQNLNTKNSLASANTELNEKLNEITENKNAINSKIEEVNTKKQIVQDKIDNLTKQYNELNTQITSLKQQIAQMSQEDEGYTNIYNSIENLTKTSALLQETIEALNGTVSALEGTDESLKATYSLLLQTENSVNQSIEANTLISNLVDGNNQVVSSSLDTINKMRTLSGAVSQLENGSHALEQGAGKLEAGTTQLQIGSTQLYEGAKQVNNGAKELSNGTISLKTGTTELVQGSEKLYKGLEQYNNEAISPITNLVNGKIKNTVDRIKVLKDLAEEYKSFTEIDEENNGKVKFITIIDSVKNENNKNNSIEKIEEKSGN